MTPSTFKITLHMVASVDGYIAKPDNSIGWFETVDSYDKGVTGGEAAEILQGIDCYIMGARTYELALALSRDYGWPYGDTPTVVLTHREMAVERASIELYAGELERLVRERLRPRFGNVWVVGGAELTKAFLQAGLADEIRMPILPILLGDGLRFFDKTQKENHLHLIDVTAYKNGMVELRYAIRR